MAQYILVSLSMFLEILDAAVHVHSRANARAQEPELLAKH